jgi:hypothetical protein
MGNDLSNDVKRDSAVAEMVVSRVGQEVQISMAAAKKFPRDENEAHKKIMRSCARIGLAEVAEYTYPRGDKKVSGPSIRLAEAIAQGWGNIEYGIIELENSKGKSEMMAYAWDLESNSRVTKVFSVKHWRDTKQGGYALKDERDIYELTANFGARRVRACILGIIPGDIIDGAIKECRKTIKGDNKTPIEDRIKIMLNAFEKEHRIDTAGIEEYIGCKAKAFSENDLIKLRGIHQSIVDGMSTPADYFGKPDAPKSDAVPVVDPFAKKPAEAQTTAAPVVPAPVVPKTPPPPKPAFDENKFKEDLKISKPHYDDSYIDHLTKEAKAKW